MMNEQMQWCPNPQNWVPVVHKWSLTYTKPWEMKTSITEGDCTSGMISQVWAGEELVWACICTSQRKGRFNMHTRMLFTVLLQHCLMTRLQPTTTFSCTDCYGCLSLSSPYWLFFLFFCFDFFFLLNSNMLILTTLHFIRIKLLFQHIGVELDLNTTSQSVFFIILLWATQDVNGLSQSTGKIRMR